MDNSNMSKNRQNEYLGVNKIGKNIRKSPLHQPTFANNNGIGIGGSPARQQPQPQVYNISKNDFRSIVQQLTGSPSQHDPLPRPNPSNPPKHPSMRLQRIRPPPLMPINRPPVPPVVVTQCAPMAPPQGQFHNNFARPPPHFGQPSPRGMPPPEGHFNNSFARPPPQFSQPSPRGMPPPQFGQPSPRGMPPPQFGQPSWTTPSLSPISAYMQQLQSCIGEGGPRPGQPQMQPQMTGQVPAQHHMQPQVHGYMSAQSPNQRQVPGQVQAQPQFQPQVPGQFQAQQSPGHVQAQPPSSGMLHNPNVPPLPSPGIRGLGVLPSPTSQFFLSSPGGYFNLLSPTPRSPYPLLSPGSQFPTPLSPNFAFSPFGQTGFFGPGPQPPLSPGIAFPSSPSGFFPISSPRWRD